MWCSVKNCWNNRNGQCDIPDYIGIDYEGKCDSIREMSEESMREQSKEAEEDEEEDE